MYELPSRVEKIINYVRKSREEELQELKEGIDALNRQKIQLEKAVSRFNVRYETRLEYGSGDKIELRPIFQQVLKDIENGEFQAIAVREISRLGRGSYEDMGKIFTLLEQRRILIITETGRVYDLRNSDDAKFVRMQMFMSREEYMMIKERLVGARYFKASTEGKFMSSHPPYGYISNPKTKKLEPDEEKAKHVRWIFDWYVNEKIGYQAISTKLTNMGIPTSKGKKRWQPQVIRRMLLNPVYIGEIHYRTTERINGKQIPRPEEEHLIYEDAHPPLVDKETFLAATQKLNDRRAKIPPVKLDFSPCELASLIVHTCGNKMVRQYSTQHYKRRNGEISTYHKEFLYCRTCGISVKYRDVENQILTLLKEISEWDEETLTESISNSISYDNNSSNNNQVDLLKAVEDRKKKLKKRLLFIHEQFEDGTYTKEEFVNRRATTQEEIDRVDKEISKIKNELPEIPEETFNINHIRSNITTIIDAYNKLENKSRKNELLRAVFSHFDLEVISNTRPKKFRITPELNYEGLV